MEDYEEITLSSENIQKLQILYLETMYRLNENSVERFKLDRAGEYVAASEVRAKDVPIVERAKEITKRVQLIRKQTWELYEANETFRVFVDAKAKDDVCWWINNFVWTYDPRLTTLGIPPDIPFVLFPAQEDFINTVIECYRDRRPILVEKSRAWGATEIFGAIDVHAWLFTKGYKGSWCSRVESLVDSLSDPDTIFARIRRMIYSLPQSMRPSTFRESKGSNDNVMRIINPDNGSVLAGYSGDNAGRGGRSSSFKADEAAHIENFKATEMAMSRNTDFRVLISTPNGPDEFYKARTSGRYKVLTCWWYSDPSKNPLWRKEERPKHSFWYERETLEYDPLDTATNVDINYNASTEGAIIDAAWVNAAIDFDIPAQGTRAAGFDVADGGANKSVYVSRIGARVNMPKVYTTDALESMLSAIDAGEDDEIANFNYDLSTIGKPAHDAVKLTGRRPSFKTNGILGQSPASENYLAGEGRTGKDKFANRRAELWWGLRDRFYKTWQHVTGVRHYPFEEMISIPNCPELLAQLSSVERSATTSGKLLAESKKSMRAKGKVSPDYADALAYCFADYFDDSAVIRSFDTTSKASHIAKMSINWETEHAETFVSIIQTPDQQVNVVAGLWNGYKFKLRVFYSDTFFSELPSEVVEDVKMRCHAESREIREWLANVEMFPEGGDAGIKPYYLYRKAGVTLVRNYTDDSAGSIILLNTLFRCGAVQISEDCEELILQLSTWRNAGGKPMVGLGQALALAQIVTRLRKLSPKFEDSVVAEYGRERRIPDAIEVKGYT